MSLLKQYARIQKGEQTEMLTARIPKDIYDKFKEHCKGLGLPLTDGIYYLMVEELKRLEEEKQRQEAAPVAKPQPQPQQAASEQLDETQQAASKKIDIVIQGNTPNSAANTQIKKSSSRGFYLPYKIGNGVACPLCGRFELVKNFGRHAKKHDLTPEEIFLNNKEAAQLYYEKELAKRQGEPLA